MQIESSLRPQSPKNGSFSSVRRRLSAISLRECPKSEPGDWWPIRKSPPLAGLSASIRDSFSERRTAWLTWEDSNFHITFSRNAFEMSTEFPLFWPRIRLGDFCNSKLKRWQGNTTRCPSQKPDQRFDVRACFEALYQLEGARAALLSTDVRVMLWNGRKDLAHDKMQGARRQGKAELFFRPRRPPWAIRYLEPR